MSSVLFHWFLPSLHWGCLCPVFTGSFLHSTEAVCVQCSTGSFLHSIEAVYVQCSTGSFLHSIEAVYVQCPLVPSFTPLRLSMSRVCSTGSFLHSIEAVCVQSAVPLVPSFTPLRLSVSSVPLVPSFTPLRLSGSRVLFHWFLPSLHWGCLCPVCCSTGSFLHSIEAVCVQCSLVPSFTPLRLSMSSVPLVPSFTPLRLSVSTACPTLVTCHSARHQWCCGLGGKAEAHHTPVLQMLAKLGSWHEHLYAAYLR